MKKFIIIKTTFPNLKEAQNLANILLTKKLAACAQFLEISSSYIWEGKLAQEKEILVEIKAKSTFYKEIEKEIIKNHSYKTPEIIVVNIEKGSKDYLAWIAKACE